MVPTEFPSWTYSHEDSVSFSSYVVAEGGGSDGVFSVSLFLRSLKPDGLLFQLRREEEAYFSLYLGMGRVFVSSLANGIPVTAPIFMTTGEKRFLQVCVHFLLLLLVLTSRTQATVMCMHVEAAIFRFVIASSMWLVFTKNLIWKSKSGIDAFL